MKGGGGWESEDFSIPFAIGGDKAFGRGGKSESRVGRATLGKAVTLDFLAEAAFIELGEELSLRLLPFPFRCWGEISGVFLRKEAIVSCGDLGITQPV